MYIYLYTQMHVGCIETQCVKDTQLERERVCVCVSAKQLLDCTSPLIAFDIHLGLYAYVYIYIFLYLSIYMCV